MNESSDEHSESSEDSEKSKTKEKSKEKNIGTKKKRGKRKSRLGAVGAGGVVVAAANPVPPESGGDRTVLSATTQNWAEAAHTHAQKPEPHSR